MSAPVSHIQAACGAFSKRQVILPLRQDWACFRGRGPLGLLAFWMDRGTSRVMAKLWSVSSQPTSGVWGEGLWHTLIVVDCKVGFCKRLWCRDCLHQHFSAFRVLRPFHTVPHVVVAPNHNIIYNFSTLWIARQTCVSQWFQRLRTTGLVLFLLFCRSREGQ